MVLSNCPMCNSHDVKTAAGPMTFQTPNGEVRIPKVTRLKCQNCREEFFDHEANVILDRYRLKRAKGVRRKQPAISGQRAT